MDGRQGTGGRRNASGTRRRDTRQNYPEHPVNPLRSYSSKMVRRNVHASVLRPPERTGKSEFFQGLEEAAHVRGFVKQTSSFGK